MDAPGSRPCPPEGAWGGSGEGFGGASEALGSVIGVKHRAHRGLPALLYRPFEAIEDQIEPERELVAVVIARLEDVLGC